MKGKKTNSLKPPLTKRPFVVGYQNLYEMSDWNWWVPETKKAYRPLQLSLMKFWGKTIWGEYDKRAKSRRGRRRWYQTMESLTQKTSSKRPETTLQNKETTAQIYWKYGLKTRTKNLGSRVHFLYVWGRCEWIILAV